MTGPAPIVLYVLGVILGLAGLAVILLGLAGTGLTLAYSNYRAQEFVLAAIIFVVALSVGVALIYCANRVIARANSTSSDAP